MKTFKYLGSLLTNQNSIQEEIKCRLKAGNKYRKEWKNKESRTEPQNYEKK